MLTAMSSFRHSTRAISTSRSRRWIAAHRHRRYRQIQGHHREGALRLHQQGRAGWFARRRVRHRHSTQYDVGNQVGKCWLWLELLPSSRIGPSERGDSRRPRRASTARHRCGRGFFLRALVQAVTRMWSPGARRSIRRKASQGRSATQPAVGAKPSAARCRRPHCRGLERGAVVVSQHDDDVVEAVRAPQALGARVGERHGAAVIAVARGVAPRVTGPHRDGPSSAFAAV